jgi:hypothetical protein
VDFAVAGKVAPLPGEHDVCDEVADAAASADGEDDFPPDSIYRDVGAYTGVSAAI